MVLDSGPRSMDSMKTPSLRTGHGGLYSEGGWVKGRCLERRKGYDCVFTTQTLEQGPVLVSRASPRLCPLSPHVHSLSDNQFRMSILERLEQMEKRMAEIAAAGQAPYRGPDAPPIQVPPRGGHSTVGSRGRVFLRNRL